MGYVSNIMFLVKGFLSGINFGPERDIDKSHLTLALFFMVIAVRNAIALLDLFDFLMKFSRLVKCQ